MRHTTYYAARLARKPTTDDPSITMLRWDVCATLADAKKLAKIIGGYAIRETSKVVTVWEV